MDDAIFLSWFLAPKPLEGYCHALVHPGRSKKGRQCQRKGTQQLGPHLLCSQHASKFSGRREKLLAENKALGLEP